MRYVLVSNVKGSAGQFNERIREEVKVKFGVKGSTLPPHFTIKAPFEYDGELETFLSSLDTFSKTHKKVSYEIDGYDCFDERVVYMDVKMSPEGKQIHDELIDVLNSFPFIQFKENEGKNKTFHVTIASKKVKPIFKELYAYVQEIPCHFHVEFDNIGLYQWAETRWVLVKEWQFQ